MEVPDDMWSPYKQLHRTIETTILNPNEVSIANLEMCLKRHKQTFANFLRNPPKNDRNRSQLQSHISQGVPLPGNSRTLIISKDLVDECNIISDMFDLDEYLALELLCTAQRQMHQYPGLPRGLIAVLLYYDGRKAIANSLRDLFQVTNGVCWVTESPNELTTLVSSFTQSLVDDSNILDRLGDLLLEMDITKELSLLMKNRAIGSNKHQNQVIELFEDVRMSVATALFNWSAQRSLPKAIIIKLFKNISKCKSTENTGELDDTTLTMLMAILYSYDTSILQKQDDNRLINNLNIIKDNDFIQQICQSLFAGAPCAGSSVDNSDGIKNLIKFSFGLALSGLRHAPQYLENSTRILDYDEQLVDDAISGNIFKFMYYFMLPKKIIYKNEFFYRRFHNLFTDFIDYMHSKVTELRGRADETAKTLISFMKEGLEPPSNLDFNFEMLLLCIGKFYEGNKSGLSLCAEYWGPLEVSTNFAKTTTRSVSLFKFIRLAGELLPTTLFVPYLKMIAGLTSCERSARNTFNLLKQSTGLTGSSALSWEHFFASLSRYYTNLRQEYCSTTDVIYRSRVMSRNINPQEIEGLRAVLEVVRAVATHDEVARVAICEHPNWNPLYTLIGLLSCSVPLYLKADILKTLAALAKSKETATQLWNNLEASQIIKTIPSSNAYSNSNLEVEIEQNECRLEKYPLTESILDLLYSLITTSMPKNLGGGPRKPGFDPYLKFVINGILLKFYNRTYKDSWEKWEVGSKCLKLIEYLLSIYEVSPKDFDEKQDCNPAPGYHIMVLLHTKSDLLRLILQILDDTRMQLDDYRKFNGKEQVEESALLCLKIIKSALKYQDLFFEAHSVANSTILLCGLSKMLLDVNPRSGNPDHILNSTHFLTYFSWLPYQALEAVKILHMVAKQPKVNSQIVGIFTQNETVKNVLRQGFVECLESEYVPSNSADTTSDLDCEREFIGNENAAKVDLQIKEAIIRVIQDTLYQPSPNLGHVLLGFDHLKDMQIYKSQRLGVFKQGSNCTKSLVTLLENHLEMKKTYNFLDIEAERVIDRAYNLLYSLCQNAKTSEQILRYLRTRHDFLCHSLIELPTLKSENSYVINQISNLLKCTAIELKMTASNCQLSRFQQLSEIFVGASSKNKQEATPMELSNFYTNMMHTFVDSRKNTSAARSNLLCDLLNFIELEAPNIQIPKWEFFDRTLIEQILKECEHKTEDGQKLVDIKKVHSILHNELKMVQSTIASGQRKLILNEIESVMLYALKVNEHRSNKYATIKFAESWSQVTEILFSCAPSSCINASKKQELIIDILQKVLSKIVPNQTLFEISVVISGTILLLLVNLRYCFSNSKSLDPNENDRSEYNESELTHSPKSNTLNLKFILKYILEWILISGVASQKLRINLYASLLNCLNIIKEQSQNKTSVLASDNYISRLDKSNQSSLSDPDTNHIRMSVEVLLSFGDKLMEIICHDCIAGHDICKMSALACIDVLLDIDSMSNFMNFIASRGYLSHIIESLVKSDDQLCNTLTSVPENIKHLYVYESKMSMLLCLARTHVGAELLLSNKVLEGLSSMKVFDMHPDLKRKEVWHRNDDMDFIPAIDSRFRQILFPALNLCDSLLTTLGTENYSVISQVTHFLLSHCDMVEIVLRSGSPFSDLGLLQEISFLTGIIARTFNQETLTICSNNSIGDIGVNLYRIQKLVLSMYLRFIVGENVFKDMLKPGQVLYEQSEENSALHIKYFLEISANVTLYCRNIVANHSADHRSNGLLFSPNIKDLVQVAGENRGNSISRSYNLNIIINQLKGSVGYYHSQKATLDNLQRQKSNNDNISFDPNSKSKHFENIRQYDDKQTELALCVFISEQCLYILWTHLDYFIRYTLSSNNDLVYFEPVYDNEVKNGIECSEEELITLKKTLISVFNETFSKQLCSMVDPSQETNTVFINALLRRIKSLIQFVPMK